MSHHHFIIELTIGGDGIHYTTLLESQYYEN